MGTVLTHDGLKIATGVLRNQQDLMHLLLVRKFKHLWVFDKIVKFLTPKQVAQVYNSAGVKVVNSEDENIDD